jgi:hypothetical protein
MPQPDQQHGYGPLTSRDPAGTLGRDMQRYAYWFTFATGAPEDEA